MIWMVLFCLLPLLLLAFMGGTIASGYLLPILIGGMVIVHLVIMYKGRGNAHENRGVNTLGGDTSKNKETHHCCH